MQKDFYSQDFIFMMYALKTRNIKEFIVENSGISLTFYRPVIRNESHSIVVINDGYAYRHKSVLLHDDILYNKVKQCIQKYCVANNTFIFVEQKPSTRILIK